MLKKYSKFMDVVEKIVETLLWVALLTMVLAMLYQVVLRYIFNASNVWSEELSCFLFAYEVMLGAALATRKGSHLQVDFLINLLKPKAKCLAVIVSTLLGVAFLLFFMRYAIILCQSTGNSISTGLKLPMSYVYACLPLGAGLMVLSSIEVILKNVEEMRVCGERGGQQ